MLLPDFKINGEIGKNLLCIFYSSVLWAFVTTFDAPCNNVTCRSKIQMETTTGFPLKNTQNAYMDLQPWGN